MNMISELRQRVLKAGTATISVDEFNQLQAEWIQRAMPGGVFGVPLKMFSEKQEPAVTNLMKASCMGEYSWQESADYYDENGNIVEYVATREVPWDLCKTIYKQMATMANASLSVDAK